MGYSATGDNTGGLLTVSNAMHSTNLGLLGQYAAAGFATAPDQGGGTVVSYVPAQTATADPTSLAIPQH